MEENGIPQGNPSSRKYSAKAFDEYRKMISMEADAALGLNPPKSNSKVVKPKTKKQSVQPTKPKTTSLTSSKSPSVTMTSSKSPSVGLTSSKSPSITMPAPSSSTSTKKSTKRPVIYTTEEEDEELKRNLSEGPKANSIGDDDDDDFGWDSLDSDDAFKPTATTTKASDFSSENAPKPTVSKSKSTQPTTKKSAQTAVKPKTKTVKSKATGTSGTTTTYKYNSADQLHKKPIPKSERTFVPVEDTSSSMSGGPKQYKNAQGRVVAMSYDGGVGSTSPSIGGNSAYKYNSADQLHKKPIPRSQRTFVPAENQGFTQSSSVGGAYELRNANGRVVAMSYDGGMGNTSSGGGYQGNGLLEQGWERLSSLAKNVASTTQKTIRDSGVIDAAKKMSSNFHNYMLSDYSREQNGIAGQSTSYQQQGRWNGGVEIKTKIKSSDWDFCKEYTDEVDAFAEEGKPSKKNKKKVVYEEVEEEEEEENVGEVVDNDIDELDELFSHDATLDDNAEETENSDINNDSNEIKANENENENVIKKEENLNIVEGEEEEEEEEEKEKEEGGEGEKIGNENENVQVKEGIEEEEEEEKNGDIIEGEEAEGEEEEEQEEEEVVVKKEEEPAVVVPTPTKKEKKQKVVRIIEDVDTLSPPL